MGAVLFGVAHWARLDLLPAHLALLEGTLLSTLFAVGVAGWLG